MTPTAVRMVLVEGADGGGVTLDSNVVDVPIGDAGHSGATELVVAAILGTRESVDEGAHRLAAIGVAWTDHADGARLRQALRADDIGDVVMVSELHAASALAQAVGRTIGYERTALLFVEASDPSAAGAVVRRLTVTMAVVRTVDGAVVAVQTRASNADDIAADLQDMVAALELAAEPPQAVFLIGAGWDVAALSARIAESTPLPVHAPDDADLALARGAALAAAGRPRFEAETVEVTAGSAGSTGRFGSVTETAPCLRTDAADTAAGATRMAPAGYMAPLGYSAVIDDDEAVVTPDVDESPADEPGLFAESEPTDESGLTDESEEKPFLLVGSTLATIFVVGVVALVISLAVSIRPVAELRPGESRTPTSPTAAGAETGSSTALETIQAPVPVVREAPRTAFVPAPAARPQPPAPAAPAAPAPVLPAVPAPVPPAAPAPVVTVPAAPAPAIPPIVLAPMIPVLPPFVQAPVRIPTLPATVPPSVAGPSTTGPPTTAPSVTAPSNPTTSTTATVAPTSPPTSEAPVPTVTSEAPVPTVTSEAPVPTVTSEASVPTVTSEASVPTATSEVVIPTFSGQSSGNDSGSEE